MHIYEGPILVCYTHLKEISILCRPNGSKEKLPSICLKDLHLEYQFQRCKPPTQDQTYAQQPTIHIKKSQRCKKCNPGGSRSLIMGSFNVAHTDRPISPHSITYEDRRGHVEDRNGNVYTSSASSNFFKYSFVVVPLYSHSVKEIITVSQEQKQLKSNFTMRSWLLTASSTFWSMYLLAS